MEDLASLPPVLWVVLGVAVLGIVITLIDLARSDVRHLPKPAWAVIIALVQFPIGAIVYLVVGRVPRERRDAAGEPAAAAAPPAPPEAPTLSLRDADGASAPPHRATQDHVVHTRGLGKDYGDAWGLRDVDLAVPRGAIYGLIGPNGAGKTTMLSILAGLRRPTDGDFHLGVDRSAVGVVVDTPQFEPWLTAREVLDLARHLTAPDLPSERVDAVLELVRLTDVADRRVGGFSRGMLQRLGLAGGLIGDPQLLILDEPSSALDPAGRREVLDLIGRLGGSTTVLLSTHILSDVQQVADVVGVIDHGRLRFQGPIGELLARTSTAYSLHVRGPVDGLADALRARPWSRDVIEQAPGRLRLIVDDATRAEVEVPGLLAAAGAALVSFTPATDLETAFLELTT